MPDSATLPQGRSRLIDGAVGKIHLRDFGGGGPVILALHGVTGCTYLWDGVAGALNGQARVIAMDFRGHGQSDWSADRLYSTDAYVEDLEAVLDALDLPTPPVLMGASWGALGMLRVAARRPEAAAALIVVDVEPSFEASATDVFPRPYRFDDFDAVLEWERAANPAAPDNVLAAFARGSVVETGEGSFYRRHDPFFLTKWPFRDDDLWEELAAITLPALVINGDRSFVRRTVCEKMVTTLSNGAFAAVADSGHLIALEQPQTLANLTTDFMKMNNIQHLA